MDLPIVEELAAVLGALGDRAERARRAAEVVCGHRGHRCVGIYEIRGGEICVVGWSGPGAPTYPCFPVSQGLCGAAVQSRRAVVVGDVTKDPRYLTTLGSTRSEIVVPILRGDAVAGVLDVESEHLNAFGDEERGALEVCASALARLWE